MLSTIITSTDVVKAKDKLESLEDSMFTSETEVESLLNKHLSPNEKDSLSLYCQEKKLSLKSKKELEVVIDNLKKDLQGLTEVLITFAYQPSVQSLSLFKNLLSEKTGNNVVLDINTDSSILGGAIIEYKGKFGDYSLNNSFSRN